MKKMFICMVALLMALSAVAAPAPKDRKSRKELERDNAQLQQRNHKLKHTADSLQNVINTQTSRIMALAEETHHRQVALAATPQKIYEAARNEETELFTDLLFNNRRNPKLPYELVSTPDYGRLPLFCAVVSTTNLDAVKEFMYYGLANKKFICSANEEKDELNVPTQYAQDDDILAYLLHHSFYLKLDDADTLFRGYCSLNCNKDENYTWCRSFVDTYKQHLDGHRDQYHLPSSWVKLLDQEDFKAADDLMCSSYREGQGGWRMWYQK